MYINLKWIMIFFYVHASHTPNSKQPNRSEIASILRCVHLLPLLLAFSFSMASWLDEIDMWICGIFLWRGRCPNWLWPLVFQKNNILSYLESLYTIVTLSQLFPFYSLHFLCLKFYLNLKIHIVDCLMHLQWPFTCKDRIHQGKFSTNNWWMCALRMKPSRKMGFNEFDLSLSTYITIMYQCPMV
jgi:hypothetical protein